MKPALVLSIVAGLPLALQSVLPPQAIPCANPLVHELLVAYEVSGGTAAGPFDQALAVYNDGSARLSSYLGDGPGSAELVFVGAAEVADLHRDLVAAGAMTLCDAPDFVTDVPLSTLTILRGSSRQRGNTFSWFVPGGCATCPPNQFTAVENRLQGFIATHFPTRTPGSGF